MNEKVRTQLEKFNNNQWANAIVALIIVAMIGFAIEPMATIMFLISVLLVSARAGYELAKAIDWFDDNIHSKVEMTRQYHLVYALGISILIGTVVAYVGAKVLPFPPAWYAVISPRLVFFPIGFVCSTIGYAIAWKTIPNKKER